MNLPIRHVRLNVFAMNTGYTEKAIREKIRTGAWAEGTHYRRAPDGHILVDLEGYQKWVEGKAA